MNNIDTPKGVLTKLLVGGVSEGPVEAITPEMLAAAATLAGSVIRIAKRAD